MTEIYALEKIFQANPIPTIVIEVIDDKFTVGIANSAYLLAENFEDNTSIVGKDFFETCRDIAETTFFSETFHSILSNKAAYQKRYTGRNISTYPILSERGEVDFIVLQVLNLTLQKPAEANKYLKTRPELDLFDFSPVPMWVYDIDNLRILAANKAALADYGYTLTEFLDTTVRILWPAAEVPRMEEMIAKKVKKDLPNRATVKHLKKSGETISVNIHSVPLPSWGKNARIVAAIDVSQKLRDEQVVKKNRDRLKSLLQTTSGIVWEADPESHDFSYVSRYVEQILGYSDSQWLADTNFYKKHIIDEDRERVLKTRNSCFEIGKTYSIEYRMIHAEGNIVWVRDTFTPIMQGDRISLRGLMIDISEAKRAVAIDQLDKEILTSSADEGNSFNDIVKRYITGIEQQFPGLLYSLLHMKGGRLSNLASPSIPKGIITASEMLTDTVYLNFGDTDESSSAYSEFSNTVLENGFSSVLKFPIHDSKTNVVAILFVYLIRPMELRLEEVNLVERITALLRLILERKRYAEGLKETTLMMLQSQELARFGNWSWNIKSDTVTWSDTLYSIYGLTVEDFSATFEGYLNVVHPEDRQKSFNAIQELLKNGKDKTFEERMVRPDGEVRHIKTWAKMIHGENGMAEKMIGACLDITESKQIQDELLKSRAELQKMLDRYIYVNKATNDAIYDWAIDTDFIEWGESFTRIFGYKESSAIVKLKQWLELVHPEDREVLTNSLQKALDNPVQDRWSAEYRIKNAKSEYVFVEENGYILRGEKNKASRMIGVIRNITGRKNAERDLQLSNEKYTDLFQLSPLPIWVYDLDTLEILDVNKAALDHYEYSAEEFRSFTLRNIRPPEDVVILEELISKQVKAGHEHTSFTRHLKKSGEIILVNTKGNSINYKGRNARIVVAIDNSEKIKAEDSLRQSERRFKTMIQEGSDLIVILNNAGKISYVSPNIARMLNLDSTNVILTNPFDYIHEDDHATLQNQLRNIKKDETIKVSPYRIRLISGEIRWLETIITNKSDDPAIGGIIANSRDISSRMKSMLKTKELLDRYNAVSKATSDAIWDVNLQTGRIIWNHSLTQIFGYEELQTSIEWWRDHLHPDDFVRVTSLIEDQLNSKEAKWTSEYRFRCADGSYKTVLDRGFIIFSDSGAPVRMIGCIQDITQRVAYINAIENHNQRLREIAWMQSHLVRAPLARILGISEILSEGHNNLEEINEMLSYLTISAVELDNIIKNIVDKSRNL